MIATTIGRTFLKAYNEKYKKTYSAKDFFEKEFAPLFFDHPRYLMTGGNSPLENPKISWKKGEFPNAANRRNRIDKTIEKIDDALNLDMSIAIGFPASEAEGYGTTSGLVTDIAFQHKTEDAYYSWIGGGLAIGVGDYSIFFDYEKILLSIYDGWKEYRKLINDKIFFKLKDKQINTWNGQWLNFVYGKDFTDDFDFNTFQNNNFFSDTKEFKINTIEWSRLFFSLSYKLEDLTLTAYVFSLGQTNKTLGFYPFHFNRARGLKSFYKRLFGEQAALEQAKQYEELFGIHIKRACELGAFGLQALEPKDLKKYYGDSKTLKLIKPNLNPKKGEDEKVYEERKKKLLHKDYENLIYYRTYKTWLLAMITKNKEESLEYTKEVAEALQAYRKRVTKTDRINLIQTQLLTAKSKKVFIDTLVEIVKGVKDDIIKKDVNESELDIYKELRDRVHMMNSEDFGYFVVLLKFDFAYAEREMR